LADNVLKEVLSEKDESELLQKCALKKISLLQRRYNKDELRPKLFNYLLSRGFSPGTINSWIHTNLSAILDNVTNKL